MHSIPRGPLILILIGGLFAGCLTRSQAPAATGRSPEYQTTLAKLVRVPQPHPLLDEGTVPIRALEILVAYQEIARRGKYRELIPFYDDASRVSKNDFLEARYLRREVETGPSFEILRDLGKFRDPHGVRYDFEFESVQRAQTRSRRLMLLERPDQTIILIGDDS